MTSVCSARRAIVLHEKDNPTTDYFVRPYVFEHFEQVEFYTLKQLPAPEALKGAVVIVVRYLTPQWRALLQRQRSSIAALIYFMDDDLFDFSALRCVTGGLGWKWAFLAWRHRDWLAAMSAELWVSSPHLLQKYAHWHPQLLPLSSPYLEKALPIRALPNNQQPWIFYHGSCSHYREIAWLLPVFEAVLAAQPNIQIELIGNRYVTRQFRHLEQVVVCHPMSWPAYKRFIARPGRTLGLAPLLTDVVNQARSPTKFFDIQAAGALGIYAADPVYKAVVEDGVNGYLLPMDQKIWIDKILNLCKTDCLNDAVSQ